LTAAWFIIFFAWTSTLAMLLRAITGEAGFGYSGSIANKVTFVLYASAQRLYFPVSFG